MATEKTTYKKNVERVKHKLRQDGSSFTEWAKEHGYTVGQVYRVTRRSTPCGWGITREIAEKLGIIKEEQHA